MLFRMIRYGLVWFYLQLSSAFFFGSVWFGLVRLGWVRLGWVWLGLGFSCCVVLAIEQVEKTSGE